MEKAVQWGMPEKGLHFVLVSSLSLAHFLAAIIWTVLHANSTIMHWHLQNCDPKYISPVSGCVIFVPVMRKIAAIDSNSSELSCWGELLENQQCEHRAAVYSVAMTAIQFVESLLCVRHWILEIFLSILLNLYMYWLFRSFQSPVEWRVLDRCPCTNREARGDKEELS